MTRLFQIMAVVGILLLLNPGCSKKSTKSSDDQEQPPPSLTGKIVFVSDRTGADELYSMNSNGTEVERLTLNSSEFPEKICPRISPDGVKVAFSNSSGSIYVFDFVTKTTEKLFEASDSLESQPQMSWSPDSKRICFSGISPGKPPKIWLFDTGSKALTKLTHKEWSYDAYPSWSPKGDLISFWRQDAPSSYTLYLMNTAGSELRSIASDEDMGFSDWSPDASKIAYDCLQRDIGVRWVVLINPDGTNRIELTSGEYPSFSPDGKYLVFCRSDQQGHYQIYRMDVNGSNEVKLSTVDQYSDYEPDW